MKTISRGDIKLLLLRSNKILCNVFTFPHFDKCFLKILKIKKEGVYDLVELESCIIPNHC